MNNLFNCSLWGDEAFSAVLARRPFWPMMKIVANDTSPPLMYIIMWIWFRIFGSSEISIRSLSLLFYLGTMIFIYLIAKELFSKKAAIWSVLLSFFNPFLFPYAFEGRMYFCLLFFVTASYYFLIKKNNLWYIITASAALYSHHFAIIAIFSQFLWKTLVLEKITFKNILQTTKIYIIIGLTYIPWFYPLYLQTKLVSGGFWLGTPKLKDLAGVFVHFIIHEIVFKAQKYLPVLIVIILAIRKWSKKHFDKSLLLITWAIGPPLITFLISQTRLSIFYERYLLYCVPPIAILLASKTRQISSVFLSLLILTNIYISYSYFSNPYKRPFRQYTNWIKENVPPSIFLVNYNGGSHHLWETKYYGLNAPLFAPGSELPFFVGTAQMKEDDVITQLPPNQQIGLISSERPENIELKKYNIDNYHQIDNLYFIYISPK
jgi:hypothetical protein